MAISMPHHSEVVISEFKVLESRGKTWYSTPSIRLRGRGKRRLKAWRVRTQNYHRLLGNGTASNTLPTATGLGFRGFSFPLLKPVFGMGCYPTIRQQGFQGSSVARSDGRNPTQHVCQVRPHVHAISPGTLHQRVERRCGLATFLAAKMQVVLPPDSHRPQQPLN
jgi:hypothetical protein